MVSGASERQTERAERPVPRLTHSVLVFADFALAGPDVVREGGLRPAHALAGGADTRPEEGERGRGLLSVLRHADTSTKFPRT